MLIRSEIRVCAFGGAISRLLFAVYGMSSTKDVHIHIKANNLHRDDYSLLDLIVMSCFIIHAIIYVKKYESLNNISLQHSVVFSAQ